MEEFLFVKGIRQGCGKPPWLRSQGSLVICQNALSETWVLFLFPVFQKSFKKGWILPSLPRS